MERVINRKDYRRNYNEEKGITEEQVVWLQKIIRKILLQSLCVSIIILAISFLRFYNCSKILFSIRDALNDEMTIASFKKSGQIIFDKATNYYEKLSKFVENNMMRSDSLKSYIYLSGDNNGSTDLLNSTNTDSNLTSDSNVPLETNMIVENFEKSDFKKESGEKYEAAVEGINQMSEDSKYIKENYKVTIPVIGTVTSRFGVRNSNNPIVSSYHSGLDIAANTGTQILAVIEGEVVVAETDTYFGKYIKIKKDDIEMTYAHCSKLIVKVGEKVKKGQLIGYVGNTGNSTGPHLHLEIRYKGRLIDPEDILEI